jgi:N-acetylmuramoyl-L-alanine amidase
MLVMLAVGIRAHAADEAAGRIERIELKTDGPSTKVILMLSKPLAFHVSVLDGDPAKKSARRLVLDFANSALGPEATKPIDVGNDLVRQIRPGQFKADTARIVLDLTNDTTHSVDAFESPPHVTIALANKATAGIPPAAAPDLLMPRPGIAPARAGEAPKPVVQTGPAAAMGHPQTTGALSTESSDPPEPAAAAPAAATSEPTKPAAKPIPIRARGRRPYSLLYAR